MEISLSIIVPAYNEALRIEQTLEEIVSYCNRQGLTYEVIVVDDGSADNTADVVSNFSAQNQQVRLINVVPNRG
ncbi:glycosyltransferase, partial [bacterium]|nr:glycosyltransferase [bacterium]